MRGDLGRPMTLAQRWALALAVAVAVVAPVAGGALQSQIVVPPATTFDAASVKPARSTPGITPASLTLERSFLNKSLSSPQDGVVRFNSSLQLLTQVAYNVTRHQVEGGEPWVESDRYSIEARTNRNATIDDYRSMLQSLLAERFQLRLRRDVRRLPVYELAVANGGLKIAAMKDGECSSGKDVRWDLIDLEAPLFVCEGIRRRTLSQNPETRPLPQWPRIDRIEVGGLSMPAFINFISGDLDRLVIDRTGFTAPFNAVLDFAPPARPESRLPAYSGPTIFTALEEQLGLTLVATEALVEVFVIEEAERPPAN